MSSLRERNKAEKLARICAAARDLFAESSVDAVTTQDVADRAGVAAGTLFLYARTKGELLLLAENADYEESLRAGTVVAQAEPDELAAVMAVVDAIVRCNRRHPSNGRAYLREVLFGDARGAHHAEALALTARTEETIAGILSRSRPAGDAAAHARIISGIMTLDLASPARALASADELAGSMRAQIAYLLASAPHSPSDSPTETSRTPAPSIDSTTDEG